MMTRPRQSPIAESPRKATAQPGSAPIAAVVFDGKNVRLARQPGPVAAPGEACIRMTRAAVNKTDVAVTRGLHAFQGTLGHEFVGIVESVAGPDTPTDLVGQRVVGSICTRCGRCPMCQAGLASHCRARTMLGLEARDGCLADAFVLPVDHLVPVPDSVDDDQAVFASVVAAAIQTARQLTIEGKPYITVLGDGPLGLITVQLLTRLNASVRLIGRYSEKLAICEKWGVKHRHMDDIGRRADQDVVIDCTGSPSGLDVAFELVRPRGTVVLKSLIAPEHQRTRAADLTPVVTKELNIVGSYYGPMRTAVESLAKGEVEVLSLISRRMSLSDGPALIAAAGQSGMLRVLVTP